MSLWCAKKRLLVGLLVGTLGGGLAACSSADPVAYSGLSSASHLVPNRQEDSAQIPYRYATSVNWRTYNRIIIDQVSIYSGPDQQFGDLSDADKVELVTYMRSRFTERLSRRFTRTTEPGPNTLRLKLTLTGAATNTPVLSTFSHLDLAGNLYNGVQAVRGREGLMSGSVSYAVEIYDAGSDRLLSAFVTKQFPGAMNIVASFGSLAAARTGIDKGADALADYLD